MVVPCYNKFKWIGNMLDSILAQEWDNIELILVNDGSTDGTRGVIDDYLTKLHDRGFDVIIVDQENQGVAAAVRNGLLRTTGEYVCMPDCDDELDPEYVSEMADWLWKHPEDKWVICDCDRFNTDFSYVGNRSQNQSEKYPNKLLESFFFARNLWGVWNLMIRTSYLRDCRVVDVFHVEPRIIQEPQIWTALVLGGATPIYIKKPLYKYYPREDSFVQSSLIYEKRLEYVNQRYLLIEKTFNDIKNPNEYERFLLDIGIFVLYHFYLALFPQYNESATSEKLIEVLYKHGVYIEEINKCKIDKSGCFIAMRYLSDKLMARNEVQCKKIVRKGSGRIIAYAGFSRAAKRMETGLINSDIRPDVYWDIKAKSGDIIRGIPIVQPDFKSLSNEDIVMILVWDNLITNIVTEQIKKASDCRDIVYYDEVLDYLTGCYYD